MGKFMSIIIGAVVAVVGLIGLLRWKAALLIMLKGTIPAILIFGGVIAVIAGLSELKDEMASKKEETKKEENK
jgi:hypothetical protein